MSPLIDFHVPGDYASAINYDSPRALKGFLDERGLGMRKKFGQNFLINPDARTRLLDALEIEAGDAVWEIGPGLGAMTTGLLERGAVVYAFELDPGFVRVLHELFGGRPAFTLIAGDVLKTWQKTNPPGAYLLGNLPYTIGAIFLAALIENNRFFTRMVVTVQREVAHRMGARPGSKDYSSFSVLCASAYTITPLMVLKGSSFYPIPHVDSQGVRFDLRRDIDPAAYPVLFRPLVRHLFAFRRKTIKNNLQSFVASRIKWDALEITMEALERSGIAGDKRAEMLGIEDFIVLANTIDSLLPHEVLRST
ncbi:MAG: 16S rRNA (adenine(1518)-N(6)/adenine(1519)-N(6))-dimethyltransferase RsmA [Treponema sp.]|nr:16S rRNA (adenine(1518)-N(6)/adenine(1519)-N(6))-dimethyltransferase RsmA [Treponema sp.]